MSSERSRPIFDAALLRRLRAIAPKHHSEESLTGALYAELFCRWTPPDREPGTEGDEAFSMSLHRAVGDAHYWDEGWSIVERGDRHVFVVNDRIQLFLSDPAALREVNGAVAVRLPCARPALMSGYFYAIGPGGRVDQEAPHVRFYLNVPASAAHRTIEALFSPSLRSARFEVKCPNAPGLYGRTDAAVVYSDRDDAERIARVLERAAKDFRPEVPPFTFKLASGLSVAESPPARGPAQSYGEHRCQLAARAILGAGPRASLHALDEALVSEFRRAGLSPAEPWARTLKFSRNSNGLLRLSPVAASVPRAGRAAHARRSSRAVSSHR